MGAGFCSLYRGSLFRGLSVHPFLDHVIHTIVYVEQFIYKKKSGTRSKYLVVGSNKTDGGGL